jgi:bifunctional NMN adenylyltransferase/nudix hydrolase
MTEQLMMNPRQVVADVGVLVGRWHVHELHEAHQDLIRSVISKHDRVIIFVGLSPLRNTPENPLDFNARKVMIHETFPNVEVHYLEDIHDDKLWSLKLDAQINRWLKPYQTVILYGSRDSFVPYYTGKFPTQELEATKYISGTEIRRRIANNFTPTSQFRAGMIAASLDRYPTCYPTVDVAILDKSKNMVLLGKKPGESYLRFIGGFANPISETYEADAKREVYEETGVEVEEPVYIGSLIIDDWRYRKSQDKIKTLMFIATYKSGRPEANDDIEYVEWVPVNALLDNSIEVMPAHKPLVALLAKHL